MNGRYFIMDFSDHDITLDGKEVTGWSALVDWPNRKVVALGLSSDLFEIINEKEKS